MKTYKIAILLLLLSINLYGEIIPSGGLDGKDWQPGSTQFISWDKLFMDTTQNLNIYLWNGETGALTLLASDIPAVQSYCNCTLPLSLPTSKFYKVKITYSDTTADYAIFSKDFFPIGDAVSSSLINNNSIYTIDNSKSVEITPNPANSKIKVSSKSLSSFFGIEIYNEAGAKVLSSTFDYTLSKELDVSDLASGSYTMRIKFLGEFINEKLVIIR